MIRYARRIAALGAVVLGLYAVGLDARSALQVPPEFQTPIPGVPPERTVPEPPPRRVPEPPVPVPRSPEPRLPDPRPQGAERPSNREEAARISSGDQIKLINEAVVVLHDLTSMPDHAIPAALASKAEAIVVVPALSKGGFVAGARHSKGVMSTRDVASNTWSPPVFVQVTGGNIGWQMGGESVDLAVLVMSRAAVTQLIEGKLTFGTGSIAAGPVGRSATADAGEKPGASLLAYSRARGLFGSATFEGAAFRVDDDDLHQFYGRECTAAEVFAGTIGGALPPAVETWRSAVARAASR